MLQELQTFIRDTQATLLRYKERLEAMEKAVAAVAVEARQDNLSLGKRIDAWIVAIDPDKVAAIPAIDERVGRIEGVLKHNLDLAQEADAPQ